ncbi:STAS domain-containing protein [Clostridium sp. HCP1S3_B4]|uniref:STAS domain-containing protein n=1 Tax=unclassified Clostridium TaxID=2614128 RepID=UPI002A7E9A6C|nr:STAS domain-containing protein [Clostridiales bacterium]MDY2728688.1 STAS domain-containing protein [Clostridium sp.]
MIIKKKQENNKMVIELDGRLDTNTAPKLEEEVNNVLDNIENLEINMENLQYIASAGLRVLLSLHKKIMKKGTMVIVGVNETVMEVFKVTGFSDILTIK